LPAAFSHLGTAYAPQPPVLDPNNPPPPPRAPPSAPKSSHNPFIQPLRLGSPCALSLRSKLWHWLNHSTWDCQPLRLLVSNLHQYLYGPDPPPPPEALAQPLQPLQQASDHSPQHDANPLSKQIRDLRGLKDAYMVLLELRQDGAHLTLPPTAIGIHAIMMHFLHRSSKEACACNKMACPS
jgi:hypothetical protein